MSNNNDLNNWVKSSSDELDIILTNENLPDDIKINILSRLSGMLNVFLDVVVIPEINKQKEMITA